MSSKYKGLFDDRQTEMLLEAPKAPVRPKSTFRLRKRGKRSHPDFEQVTAYVRRDTYHQIKLILTEKNQEFSDLVEAMLSRYVRQQQSQ